MDKQELLATLNEAFDAREQARDAGNVETATRADEALATIETRLAAMEAASERMSTQREQEVETREEAPSLNAQIRALSPNQTIELRADDYDTQTPEAAGNLIQNIFYTGIVNKEFDEGGFASEVGTQMIAGNQLKVPYRTSDFQVQQVAETAARPKTDVAEFGEITVDLHILHATPAITQEMLEDSHFDLASWIGTEIADTFMRTEADLFVNGTGTNEIRGVLAAVSATADDASAVEQVDAAGAALAYADLTAVEASLRQRFLPNAKWFMNRNTLAKVANLTDSSNLLVERPMENGIYRSILGKPVVLDDFFGNVGASAAPILFGDAARGYTKVEKRSLTVMYDPFTLRPYVGWYCTKRTGGNVTNGQALRALKFAA